jgi:hypothetical protein
MWGNTWGVPPCSDKVREYEAPLPDFNGLRHEPGKGGGQMMLIRKQLHAKEAHFNRKCSPNCMFSCTADESSNSLSPSYLPSIEFFMLSRM